MKKLLIAALLGVALVTSAFAGPAKISSAAKRNFQIDFKHASDVSWTAGEEYAKASFIVDKVKMEAFYNPYGEIIGTSKAITIDELPVDAKRRFAKKFDGYDVKEAIRFEGADEAAYFIPAENEKESVVIKVADNSDLSIFKRTKK